MKSLGEIFGSLATVPVTATGRAAFPEPRAQCFARRVGLLRQMQGEEGRGDEELGQACPRADES